MQQGLTRFEGYILPNCPNNYYFVYLNACSKGTECKWKMNKNSDYKFQENMFWSQLSEKSGGKLSYTGL